VWWALAAGADLIGTWLGHPIPGRRPRSENVEFRGGHLLERCRLFLIIALGETVLTTGTAIAAAPMTPMTAVTGTAAMAGVTALWALGFGRAGALALRHVDATADPVRATRHAGNALLVGVAGLIAVAVANEMVIVHPHGDSPAAVSLLLFGGPVLFLAAQAWYLWALTSDAPRLRVAGSVALIVVGGAALLAPPYVAVILAGASLTTLAALDQRRGPRPALPPRMNAATARPGRPDTKV
jgi:low temperature requirement protein LtrA